MTTIAVDLAKNVFQLAIEDSAGKITARRLSRAQFERFWSAQATPCRVVLEACSGAHHWARMLLGRGFDVVLLPPRYVRPYVMRNKTDRADAEALLQAVRDPRIVPVSIKTEEQQALAALHRVRSQWVGTRTARINAVRGLLREFGVILPAGTRRLPTLLAQALESARASPGQLARAHPQRALQREHASTGAHQQAGRSLPENPAHPPTAPAPLPPSIEWCAQRREIGAGEGMRKPAGGKAKYAA